MLHRFFGGGKLPSMRIFARDWRKGWSGWRSGNMAVVVYPLLKALQILFYPNMQNDMWRIFGHIFFAARDHFIDPSGKRFDQPRLEEFLREKGVALFDTATAVVRLEDNASDKFLQVVEATGGAALLRRLPECTAVVCTGQKATDTLLARFQAAEPRVGQCATFDFEGRTLRLWRMPSSSRAYPLKLERKAEAYAEMLRREGLL